MEGVGESMCIPSFARGLEILVVDPDMMSLTHIAWVLEQFQFKVTTIEMGFFALSMIEAERERSFNLVMVNVHMIDMSILEFTRILLKKNIPVILTTTSAHTKVALKGLKEGASFFYEKPVCLDDLRNVWQHVYRRKIQLTNSGSNSGAAEPTKKAKPGRKLNNLNLEEPSGSAKVPRKRGRKPKNKETAGEIIELEVRDCAAGHQDVTDDLKGKRKVSEEEVQIMSGNEHQGKKIRAETHNGSGELVVLNAPKGKSKQVDLGRVTPIEVDDEQEQTQDSGIGILHKESENKGTEFGTEWKQIVSMSESAKEAAEKDERDEIMRIAREKKNRVVWTEELHFKFIQAVSLLGDDKAVSKTILEKMNAPNLTHRQVASHLQKYKNQVKQISNAATPNSPVGPKSSGLNISGFQQLPVMTNAQAHEQRQRGLNLGGDIWQSLQKPLGNTGDAPFSSNKSVKLASSYIYAQNQNQLVLPFQGPDTMSAYVSSRNQVPMPMQGLNALPGNVSSGNTLLMPIQGLHAMPGHVSPMKPSIVQKYLINLTDENKETVQAAPPAGQGNQLHKQQSLDDYSDILKFIEEKRGNSSSLDSGDLNQYLEWLNSDLV